MKINIAYNLKQGPWGGGNQFLKALRVGLLEINSYVESMGDADMVLFNSYNDLWPIFRTFLFSCKKKIIYRLGPVFHTYRKGLKWKLVDLLTILWANLFADLVIFQSKWSHEQARKLGFWGMKKYSIILNSVDSSVFYKKEFKSKSPGEPVHLIYTSWSSNMKKGFAYLKFLDENLDFKKYKMTFIGNSPVEFKNIKILKAMSSQELASKLRESDIFVSPVEDDACSNALLEGMASGLPSVALRSGGNPELVNGAGVLFVNQEELIKGIDKVASNLKSYYDQIKAKGLNGVAREYVEACQSL